MGYLVLNCFMQIDMADEERDILIRWRKRSDTYKLMRMKAKAVLYVWRGVGLDMARIKQDRCAVM